MSPADQPPENPEAAPESPEDSQNPSAAPPDENVPETPPSAEAEAEENGAPHPPYTPGQKALIALLLLVIAGALVFIGTNVYRNYIVPQNALASGPMPACCNQSAKIPPPVGNSDAPIKIEAAFGHCIAGIMIPIHDAIAAYPDQFQGRFYALESLEGRDLVEEHGTSVAAIFINGESKFTLKNADGSTRQVVFQGPPGQNYTLADLVEVLRQKLAETPGGVPADFEAKMAKLRSATSEFTGRSCGALPAPSNRPAPAAKNPSRKGG